MFQTNPDFKSAPKIFRTSFSANNSFSLEEPVLFTKPTGPQIEGRFCCKIECEDPATWSLSYGPTSDDFTDSCDSHVAELLGDCPMLGAQRLQVPVLDHLDVVLDGPPGAVAGRFVELEGFYGPFPPARLQSVGGEGLRWIEDGDLWRLRIPILAGCLSG